MIHALFDPEVFFVSDAIWESPNDRMEFLNHLDTHLDFINSIGKACILWCDKYDERLWSHPKLPPWKKTRGWSIPLSQILYHKLTKYCKRLDTLSLQLGECQPPIQCYCAVAHTAFHQLITAIFINSLTPHYCPSIGNISEHDHLFRPNAEAAWSEFPEVRNPKDWPKMIDPIKYFWPTSRNDNDNFMKCIELVALSKDINPSELQSFSFTQNFLGNLILASRKERIIEMIVKRLTLTLQESAHDQQLQDEELPDGERRFRVTQRPSSLRIHYIFQNNQIVFDKFFDEGHHDDGL